MSVFFWQENGVSFDLKDAFLLARPPCLAPAPSSLSNSQFLLDSINKSPFSGTKFVESKIPLHL